MQLELSFGFLFGDDCIIHLFLNLGFLTLPSLRLPYTASSSGSVTKRGSVLRDSFFLIPVFTCTTVSRYAIAEAVPIYRS